MLQSRLQNLLLWFLIGVQRYFFLDGFKRSCFFLGCMFIVVIGSQACFVLACVVSFGLFIIGVVAF